MADKIDFSSVSFLIVDKNTLAAELLRDLLSELGANRVRAVRSTQRAVEILRNGGIDVVITGYNTEPDDGVAFIGKLRHGKDLPNRQIPIIMLTANAEPEYVAAARDAGVTEFLAKPFNVDGLYSRLVAVIARPRQFVSNDDYFGPDRRRRQVPFEGPERRSET